MVRFTPPPLARLVTIALQAGLQQDGVVPPATAGLTTMGHPQAIGVAPLGAGYRQTRLQAVSGDEGQEAPKLKRSFVDSVKRRLYGPEEVEILMKDDKLVTSGGGVYDIATGGVQPMDEFEDLVEALEAKTAVAAKATAAEKARVVAARAGVARSKAKASKAKKPSGEGGRRWRRKYKSEDLLVTSGGAIYDAESGDTWGIHPGGRIDRMLEQNTADSVRATRVAKAKAAVAKARLAGEADATKSYRDGGRHERTPEIYESTSAAPSGGELVAVEESTSSAPSTNSSDQASGKGGSGDDGGKEKSYGWYFDEALDIFKSIKEALGIQA